MLPFLVLAALALSVWLLSDLVGGACRSEQTQREQWQRAMTALSSTTDDAAREDSQYYDLAA